MVLFYLVLIHDCICTSTPDRRSPTIWHKKYVSLCKCFEKTHASSFPVHSHIMLCWRHHVELHTFCGIFKNDTHDRSTSSQTCVKQKMATSDEDAAHISAFQVCFPSGVTPIDTCCQLKSTDRYKNVSWTLVYTWHARFSDSSTVNTSRGLLKYKNCRIVKSAPDAIHCDVSRLGWSH